LNKQPAVLLQTSRTLCYAVTACWRMDFSRDGLQRACGGTQAPLLFWPLLAPGSVWPASPHKARPVLDPTATLVHPCRHALRRRSSLPSAEHRGRALACSISLSRRTSARRSPSPVFRAGKRSEEHTSELQSRENLVCRL